MTFSARKYAKILTRDAPLGMAVLALGLTAHPVYAQEAENDGPGPISDFTVEDALAGQSNASQTDPSQQLRLDRIGAVDGGGASSEGDPFAAEGMRFGTFVVRPTLELGFTAIRSVSNFDSGGPSGIVEDTNNSLGGETSLGLQVDSDWSRHSFDLDLNGTLPVGISGTEEDPTVDVEGSLNLDLSALTSLTLTGVYGYATEDPQSSAVQTAIDAGPPGLRATNEPARQLYSGTATLNHDFGGVTTQISAAIARLEYGTARLSDGSSVSQSDLNSTDYNFSLRGGYALSGVLSPFVEARYGQRVTDDLLDAAGFNRNSKRYQLRLGTEIDYGEKFSGEVAVGYGVEQFDDAALADVSGVIADAALNWSPQRGTDVTLNASTGFVPSGTEDVSGSLLYATELGLSQRLTSQLIGTAGLGVSYETFEGPAANETSINASLGLIYNLNRYFALTGRIGHEQTFSSDQTERDSSSTAFVGVRLQR